MMSKVSSNRIKWMHLRLSEAEHKLLLRNKSQSTSRNLSQYVRNIIFDKPIVATYRNLSQDDLTIQIAILNRELNALGNNLNQITKRLHTLQTTAEKDWIKNFSFEAKSILLKIDEVKEVVYKISRSWLR